MKQKEKLFRAEKTTTNRDDVKVLVVGVFVTIFLLILSVGVPRLSEYRWYRDLVHLTPFHDVSVSYQYIVGNSMTMGGLMIKRRCDFEDMIGYITGADGVRRRVPINTRPEEIISGTRDTRPPSTEEETWGPWIISNTFTVPAVLWEIQVDHVACPSPPDQQTNMFSKGQWTVMIPTKKDAK